MIDLFLFDLRFPLDFDQGVSVILVEVFVMEVAFGAIFPYFVEVVHVELTRVGGTCRTKEE